MKNSKNAHQKFIREELKYISPDSVSDSSAEKNDVSLKDAEKLMNSLEPTIKEYISRYAEPRGALLPILHLVQRELHWIPPIVQKLVAKRLKISPAEVHRVVTFYTFFRPEPSGNIVVQVCCTLSCELNGGADLLRAAEKFLGIKEGETTKDGKFTLKRVECLGWCHKAPVVQFGSADFRENVTVEEFIETLRSLSYV